jgi:two-component system NarL family sensor kinase
MIRSHQTTLQIIETLLLIYRNDSEGLELSCHPVDLGAIAEEATKPLLALAANRRIHY